MAFGINPPDSELDPIIAELTDAIDPTVKNNYGPVFHRPVDQHVGIEITGQFRTDDASDNGEISYITVLRHSPDDLAVGAIAKVVAHDGLGLAWRKQTGSGSDERYNVYIVDNNALQENIFIGSELIVENYGVNNFLVAAKATININTWYNFKVRVNSNLGILAYIWEDGDAEPSTATVQLGATAPEYVPIAAGRHFGLAVPETHGSTWWYRDLQIESVLATYPMHMLRFNMDMTKWDLTDQFQVNYRGIGYGETAADAGLRLFLKEPDTDSSWTEIGSHAAEASAEKAAQELSFTPSGTLADYLEDGYISILARPDNIDAEHTIRTYYASVDTPIPSGIHLGNMSDIYYNDPANIRETTVNYAATTPSFRLENVAGISLPVHEVIDLVNANTGETLVRNVDYHVVVNDADNAYSTRSDTTILLDTFVAIINLNIIYSYASNGVALQTLIESNDFRYPNADNLAKVMPPTVIAMDTFEYTGGVASEDMRALFKSYVNSGINDSMFEISDLIAIASANGATSVSLTSIDINYRQYDKDGALTTGAITDKLTISGLTAFYTDTSQLLGVVRL